LAKIGGAQAIASLQRAAARGDGAVARAAQAALATIKDP
jgi:hypothetical protein